MEWTEGRKLASVTYNNQETAFEYNHEGLRIKKTLHDSSYILYDIVDGVYVGETRYNASGSVAVYIRYILDEGNAPVGISLWYPATGGWTDYHFIKNLQGDVLEVYKVSDGSLAASYTYDSWGNILSQSGDLATLNPFRYRSYYYDTQTWFYYLQSRYYDPAIGRFVNADALVSTGQGLLGHNMFAYCNNNPVMGVDPYGEFDLFGAAAGFVVGAVVSMTSYVLSSGGEINVGEMLLAGTVGGISGVAASVSVTGAIIAGGISGVYTFCTSEGTLDERITAATVAAIATTAGGALAFTGCDKLLGCVKATSDIAYFIGSVAINYSIGQVVDLTSVGLQALN